jgi:hypothetical protein
LAGPSLTEGQLKGELTAAFKGDFGRLKDDFGRLKDDFKGDFGRLKDDFGRLEAMLTDRLSATRHASRINRADLESVLEALKVRVIRAQDSPELSALIGQEPDQDTPAFW